MKECLLDALDGLNERTVALGLSHEIVVVMLLLSFPAMLACAHVRASLPGGLSLWGAISMLMLWIAVVILQDMTTWPTPLELLLRVLEYAALALATAHVVHGLVLMFMEKEPQHGAD